MARRSGKTELTLAGPVAAVGRHFDSPAQEAYLNLWRTYDRLKSIEDETLGEFDLSAQQYNALRLLKSVYPDRIRTLSLGERLISRAPDMTRMLDRLEQRGLVDRMRFAANRRVVEVGITAAGLELLTELYDRVVNSHRRQLGHLADDQLGQLIELLTLARQPHETEFSAWAAVSSDVLSVDISHAGPRIASMLPEDEPQHQSEDEPGGSTDNAHRVHS